MSICRRGFLKVTGMAAASTAALYLSGMENPVSAERPGQKAVLVDTTRCVGCRVCVIGCKSSNDLPADKSDSDLSFSAIKWVNVFSYEQHDTGEAIYTRISCMHCRDAACVKACPANAISHNDIGAVVIDHNRCIGCNYCVAGCTFKTVSFDRLANVARKCKFCCDRILEGLEPGCVEICPAEALSFGERGKMIALAESRIDELKKEGIDKAEIYGVEDLDGTGMIYILGLGRNNSMKRHGLPENPGVPYATVLWGYLLKPVRILVLLGFGFSIWKNRLEAKTKPSD